MTNSEKQQHSWIAFLKKPFCWLAAVAIFFLKAGLIAWGGLAIYYSNLPWFSLRLILAFVFVIFAFWALWITKRPRSWWIFALVYAALLVWWISIQPSHDRPWRPEVAVMPHAIIDGDKVTLYGVRNFEYRSRDDFIIRYEARAVSLSHLTGVDFFISYWMPGPVGHTFVSFIFDNAPPVSISIETRPEIGQGFSPIASLFKQFELIYVVGDERDIVGSRTNYRGERVFLYPLNISRENARALFLVYLKRINELAAKPEFYHLLSNSCTVNIVRYANAAGRTPRFDIRHYLNGLIDGYLYSAGWLNSSLPFDELRRRSLINEKAKAADKSVDFSKQIRSGLPAAAEN